MSNHYTSDTHDGVPTKDQFKAIIKQFDRPFIMCGDFNGKNTLWSNDIDDPRGKQIEEFMFENDLGLLNSDVKTHCYTDVHQNVKWSLIDLTIVHAALYLDYESHILDDLHGSDHTPIVISLTFDILASQVNT